MATQLKKLWQVLKTDIREFWHPADISKTVVECVLPLGLLALPLGAIAPLVSFELFFIGIAARGLKFYHEKTKQELTLEDSIAFATQLAYLESFRVILAFPENQALLQQIGRMPVSEALKQQIDKLGELELNEQRARKALECFHESQLAKVFNKFLSVRLVQAGLTWAEAEILTERVSRNTHRYLNQALAESGDALQHLAQVYRDGWRKNIAKSGSIDEYLQEIAKKPDEQVFAENFTFRDIYVPLKAKLVDQNGDVDKKAEAVDLESWAKTVLTHSQKQDKVMFIQGGPGRGKSVFCRMFADWARQRLHPIWTPVLIRLRDIPKLQHSFIETLRASVKADFATSDDGWLTDRNARFLFLLDGFDELLMEGRTSGGLEEFLRQVGQFQRDCQQSQGMGHRVLITGRALSLHNIGRQMPHNLERVEIQPMDAKIQQQWFMKWSAQVGTDKTSAFQKFLQDQHCPDRVRELAREPLLLYMLAAMHRDGKLTVEMFEGASGVGAKIMIYQTSLKWVLTEQRPEWLNRQLTEMETAGLERILAEAALCVAQSGGECAAMQMVEERIQDNDIASGLIRQARKRLGDDALKNALAAFYLQPAAGDKGGSVEFAHKSFSEFLFAQLLKESLEEWTEPGRRGEEFLIKRDQMDWEIYDLLGYGGLTPEIVEYLMGLITPINPPDNEGTLDNFRLVQLFRRLENFYLRWCDGEFIDAPPENLPQKKMRQLQWQKIQIGQRQVDLYAGLNVMILLLELHRYGQSKDELQEQIAFYPCGEKDTESFDKSRLLRIIGYSHSVDWGAFLKTVGFFLYDTNLSGANLSLTFLAGADLSATDLSGANLNGADLSAACLIGTNLREAKLRGCFFCDSADLRGADLRGADLRGADLRGADLTGVDFSNADLANISWNEFTRWEDVRGLETAENVPEGLKLLELS